MPIHPDLERATGETGGLTELFATMVSDRSSRRHFMVRSASQVCGAMGIGFAASSVIPVDDAAGCCEVCDHSDDCTATGNWGGMSGVGCAGYAACANCLQANGCPKGSTLGASWSVCVKCENDTNRGEVFTYHDCCSTTGSLHADCNGCSPSPNCNNNAGCTIALWCGGAGNNYHCTFYENTGRVCGRGSEQQGVPSASIWSLITIGSLLVITGARQVLDLRGRKQDPEDAG